MAVDQLAFQMGALVGGLAAGVACGFIPLGTGYRRNRFVLGCIGFTFCIFAGLAAGVILAAPLGIFLSFCIRRIPQGRPNFPTVESMGYTTHNPYAGGNRTA